MKRNYKIINIDCANCAMKMEQAIPCPKAGTVKAIKVAVGDKVKSGEVMFVVE